jgi:hypothetical protein
MAITLVTPMTRVGRAVLLVLMALALSGPARPALTADDPCDGFSWRVGHERQLFGGAPASMAAGDSGKSAPRLVSDKLYELRLTAQDKVQFAAPPAKQPRVDAPLAGLARLHLNRAGLYRISLDQPFWVDAVVRGEPVHSSDFQGAAGCNAPHKIVQFMLPADEDIILQISGLAVPQVRVALTAAP